MLNQPNVGRWGAKVLFVAMAVLAGSFSPPATAATLPLPPPAAGAWSSTAAAGAANVFSLHALPDGGALAIGVEWYSDGGSTFNPTFRVERWSAETGSWSLAASPSTPRADWGAATLADGRIVLIGGRRIDVYESIASTEIFDPVVGSWSPGPTLTGGRERAVATTLPDGRVMVAGGWNGTVELLDVAAGTSTVIASPADGAILHNLNVIGNGRFVLGIGRPSNSNYYYGYLYDIAAGTWASVPGPDSYSLPRQSVVLPDGRFLTLNPDWYATRGRRVQLFDPDTRGWSYAPPTIAHRYTGELLLLAGGRVLAVSPVSGRMTAETLDANNVTAGWSPVAAPTGVASPSTRLAALTGGAALLVGFTNPRGAAVFDPSVAAAPFAFSLSSTPPSLTSTVTKRVDVRLALAESTTATVIENIPLVGGVVSGPNQGRGNCFSSWYGNVAPCVTDANGTVGFSLVGNGGAGTDIVEFAADFDKDGVADDGEPKVSVTVQWTRIETVLSAKRYVNADDDGRPATFDSSVKVRAQLNYVSPGYSWRYELPLAGATVRFMAGTRTICSAKTSQNGWAECSAPPTLVDVVMANGYEAFYDGDNQYAPSNAKGRAS